MFQQLSLLIYFSFRSSMSPPPRLGSPGTNACKSNPLDFPSHLDCQYCSAFVSVCLVLYFFVRQELSPVRYAVSVCNPNFLMCHRQYRFQRSGKRLVMLEWSMDILRGLAALWHLPQLQYECIIVHQALEFCCRSYTLSVVWVPLYNPSFRLEGSSECHHGSRGTNEIHRDLWRSPQCKDAMKKKHSPFNV